MRRGLLATAVAAAAFLSGAVPSSATIGSQCDAVRGNLVHNCGFEAGDFTAWKTRTRPGFHLGVNGDLPHSGSWQASFGSGPPGDVIMQAIRGVKPRSSYALSFWLTNTTGDPGTSFTATIANTSAGTVTALSLKDAPLFTYREYRYVFRTRAKGVPTIKFAAYNLPTTWHLDDVKVVRASTR